MQCMLVHIDEDSGPLLHLRESILRQSLTPSIKMNIAVEKHQLITTVKILHDCLFFKVKRYVNHALFFIRSTVFQMFVDGH